MVTLEKCLSRGESRFRSRFFGPWGNLLLGWSEIGAGYNEYYWLGRKPENFGRCSILQPKHRKIIIFILTDAGGGATLVTWSMSIRSDFPMLHLRYVGLMLDTMLGPWLESGLNNLNRLAGN